MRFSSIIIIVIILILGTERKSSWYYASMVEGIGDTAVTVSVIGNPVPANPIPESEMDALLLGRTKVSCEQHALSMYVW